MTSKRQLKNINKFIPIHKEYMGMHWFIKTKGLYKEFLEFYKNFSLEKIDDYKQKERKKCQKKKRK